MEITHSFDGFKIKRNVGKDSSFIITNKTGGYCYLAGKPTSRYHGIFFNNHFKMYKVIDNINLLNASPVKGLINNFFNFERKRGSIVERFFMPHNFNSLVYELNKIGEIEIVLDIRESYATPRFGRYYKIFEEDGKIIISYKQTDEFECYLVISAQDDYELVEKWFRQEYELDKKRNSPPHEAYVFSAIKIKSKRLVFSFSFDKESAIRENDFVVKNTDKLEVKQKKDLNGLFHNAAQIRDNRIRMAYLCAVNSLYNLVVLINKAEGMYAGLPWFFQFWARDEALSLKALKYLRKREINLFVVKVLERLIECIGGCTKILDSYPCGDLNSADAPGWVLKRAYELNKKLLKEKIRNFDMIKQKEIFVTNNQKETWMDTLDREGVRIEIQALYLNILKSLFGLTNDGRYRDLENELKLRTREAFWNKRYLNDGLNDYTIRPNIFIAAYAYPKLLTKEEWTICFSNALDKLWLNWGGISTIDKTNQLFCGTHTGENPKSYHNGDSWFYLNNLTALVLYRTNKDKFRKYTKKILTASVDEILWDGAIGHHAELSSANIFNSEGCLAQAWSAAMFIELVEDLK